MIFHITTQICLPPKEYPFVVASKVRNWLIQHDNILDDIGHLNHPPYWYVSRESRLATLHCAELTIALVLSHRHPDLCRNPGDLLYLGHLPVIPPEQGYRYGAKVFQPERRALPTLDDQQNLIHVIPPYLWYLSE